MERVRVKMLAFNGAPSFVFENGRTQILNYFDANRIEFVDQHPQVIFFISAGAEQQVMELTNNPGTYILLASKINKTYDSACMVKKLLDEKGRSSVLLDLDKPNIVESLKSLLSQIDAPSLADI